MFKWLENMMGESSAQAPTGVPARWLYCLENLLLPVEGVETLRDGLTHDMLRFVLHGTPEAVLQEVREPGDAAMQLRLLRRFAPGENIGLDIYEAFEEVPVDIALRYARLLDALVPSHALVRMELPTALRWLEVLMVHAANCPIGGYSSDQPRPASLSVPRLESMMVAAGHDPLLLLLSSFATPIPTAHGPHQQLCEQRLFMACELAGYPDALDRHLERLRPLMLPTAFTQQRHVLNMLHKADAATLSRLAPEVCELAVSTSRPVRTSAELLVRRMPAAAIAPLQAMVERGSPKKRVLAGALLTQCVERSQHAPATRNPVERPVIDWSAAANKVSPSFLQTFWQRVNAGIAEHNQYLLDHHPELLTAPSRHVSLRPAVPYDEDDQWALQAYLASDERSKPRQPRPWDIAWVHVAPVLQQMAGPGLTPVALFRTLLFFDLARDSEGKLLHPAVLAFNALHRHSARPTLLELSCMMDEAGLSGPALRRNFCITWDVAIAEEWAPEAIWPYFLHHADEVARALLNSRDNEPAFRPGLFRALALLPQWPDTVTEALFEVALESNKSDRWRAQEILAACPAKERRIVSALTDGKGARRAAAAEWLGRLGHRPAEEALKAALAQERHGAARRAMLDALQALAQPTG